MKQISTTFHGGYFAANKQYIEQLPICPINFSTPEDRVRHDRVVSLVDRMQELHKSVATNPNDRTLLEREIEATDHLIDQLVFELYGLTEDEIMIVNGLKSDDKKAKSTAGTVQEIHELDV